MKPPEGDGHYVVFGAEWTTENLRQLVETTEGGLDYIVSGALRGNAGDYEVILRIWEVKTFRERKTFNARWTPFETIGPSRSGASCPTPAVSISRQWCSCSFALV